MGFLLFTHKVIVSTLSNSLFRLLNHLFFLYADYVYFSLNCLIHHPTFFPCTDLIISIYSLNALYILQHFPLHFPFIATNYLSLQPSSSRYSIFISVKPCGGAVWPACVLSQALSIYWTYSGSNLPFPTCISVPAIILTIL